MDISFAIVNWQGGVVFEKCIASIHNVIKNSPLQCEIVIVDNGSKKEELAFLNNDRNMLLMHNQTNVGFAKGTNQSIEMCHGEYLFILNNDVILETTDLTDIYKFMEENSDVGILAPKLIYPDGRLQKSISGLPSLFDIYSYTLMLSKINPQLDKWKLDHFDYSRIGEVQQPMFSALFTRRIVWDEIGGLDERFPLLFNDVDWFFRFHKSGKWKCLFYPHFSCVHYHKLSVDKHIFKKIYYQTTGMYRYFIKNHNLSFLEHMSLIFLCFAVFTGKMIIEPTRRLLRP